MFARLPDRNARHVVVTIDGAPVTARAGDTVAAALLAAGRLAVRTTVMSGAPRGPFCLMGACFECMVEIDGRAQQGCLVDVAPGMRIVTWRGARAVASPPADAS